MDNVISKSSASTFTRRGILQGSSMLALTAVSTSTTFAQKSVDPHAGHTKGVKSGQPAAETGRHGPYAALLDSLKQCISKGEACAKHCIAMLNKGDTSLVDCLKSTQEMLPVCRALERYASINAKHLKALTQLCVTVTQECEAECTKHADHHQSCKECADACTACIAECNKVIEKKA